MARHKKLSETLILVDRALGMLQDVKATDISTAGGFKASEEALNSLRTLLEKSKITLLNLLR